MGPKSQKILITGDVIMSYIQSLEKQEISRKMLDNYISLGLPVVTLHGKLHAHADNIDRFFQEITKKQRINGEETE